MLIPRPAPFGAPDPHSPFWWLRWVPAVVGLVLLLDLLYVVGRLALVPVVAACALAYLLHPMVEYLHRRGLSRSVAAMIALLGVTLAAGGLLLFIVPSLWTQSVAVGKSLLGYFTPQNAERQRAALLHYWPALGRLVGDRLAQFIRDPAAILGSPDTWVAGGLSPFLHSAAASVDLVLVPFFAYYLLVDFRQWRETLEDLIPPRFRDPFTRLFDEVGRILQVFVRGQLGIALLMGALYAIGFALLRVPAGAGIAIVAGLLNTIPYVGTLCGILLATSFTLAAGGGGWRIAGVLGVFAAVQAIEGYLITPRILGRRMRLHPMAIFLGLLIGGKLFGVLGVILTVPTIAVAKVFVLFARALYKQSAFYHAGDRRANDALDERLADAADTVLTAEITADPGEPGLPEEAEPPVPHQSGEHAARPAGRGMR
jgi:predicted PurR-regulated permease PerM